MIIVYKSFCLAKFQSHHLDISGGEMCDMLFFRGKFPEGFIVDVEWNGSICQRVTTDKGGGDRHRIVFFLNSQEKILISQKFKFFPEERSFFE